MKPYAQGTKVDAAKTRAEIETILRKFKADGFMAGQQKLPDGREVALVAFQYKGKMIRFTMTLPDRQEFAKSPGGLNTRSEPQIDAAHEQGCKERWRALLLAIKAKLIAVESKISTLEEEFMAWIVMPNGRTAGEHILPQLDDAARSGTMPLLGLGGGHQP